MSEKVRPWRLKRRETASSRVLAKVRCRALSALCRFTARSRLRDTPGVESKKVRVSECVSVSVGHHVNVSMHVCAGAFASNVYMQVLYTHSFASRQPKCGAKTKPMTVTHSRSSNSSFSTSSNRDSRSLSSSTSHSPSPPPLLPPSFLPSCNVHREALG